MLKPSLNWLLVFLPITVWLHYMMPDAHTQTFLAACLAILPLAGWLGKGTENLSSHTGEAIGGLLNATFGNAAELIIAIIAMTKGLNDVVKASLTGSILGNLLLVGGGAMVAGGIGRERQTFSGAKAESASGLLLVAVAALLFPAIFHHSFRMTDPHLFEHEHAVSIGTSIILLIVYGLALVFTLHTHSHILSPAPAQTPEDPMGLGDEEHWSVKKSVTMLLLAAAGVSIVAELLVGSAEHMAAALGWNHVFVGVILLAIIGNAAEHSTALLLARRNDMDTAMTITYQSSLQIALFVTPFLVLLSTVFVALHVGHAQHLDLLFTPMEVVAVLLAVLITAFLGLNGETNWFEGAILLALYAVLAVAFYNIPHTGAAGAAGAP